MKKQKFEVGDRIADLSYMVDRNDLNEHAKGTITYVPMDPIISGVLVLKDETKKKGIMHESQVEYDDLIRLVKKKKPMATLHFKECTTEHDIDTDCTVNPAPVAKAREFWIRPYFIPYHILTCKPSDEGFLHVREVLDEQGEG